MESPPSYSTHSEVPPLSEDSGLLITSGSFSSDSASGWHHVASELQESDYDESLSPCESADTSERMCGDNFNTVKKGPGKVILSTIEPPPQFQDTPVTVSIIKSNSIEVETATSADDDVYESIFNAKSSLDVPFSARNLSPICSRKLRSEALYERRQCLNHRFASPRLLHLSPCRGTRPASRSSLTSRLSSSHNSLVTQFQADDSSFITQAISHDTLSANTSDITDMYNVPFDSDIYAVPIDMVKPNLSHMRPKGKKLQRIKKRKSASYSSMSSPIERTYKFKETSNFRHKELKTKRYSFQSCSSKKLSNNSDSDMDSFHMTLREMKKYLQTLYSSSSDSETKNTMGRKSTGLTKMEVRPSKQANKDVNNGKVILNEVHEVKIVENNNNSKKTGKNAFDASTKNKCKEIAKDGPEGEKSEKGKKSSLKCKLSPVRLLSLNLKTSFCNLFRWRRSVAVEGERGAGEERLPAPVRRALPPLPPPPPARRPDADDSAMHKHFAASIHKVKDYGWYWGPISVETAEKILSNEPDGSFIVRDSSDDHYIFTLTFKLNGLRHVRIEHDQGNFCFGGCTMFKAQTIVEFIENAVETSRSGRYLFFLNLRPVLGPVRVQLLYPVSRFKRVQSLQHMCRFVILKHVRRDLVSGLPLPRRLLDYLQATHYFSEMLSEI